MKEMERAYNEKDDLKKLLKFILTQLDKKLFRQSHSVVNK